MPGAIVAFSVFNLYTSTESLDLNGKFELNEGVKVLDRVNKTLPAKIKKAKRQGG